MIVGILIGVCVGFFLSEWLTERQVRDNAYREWEKYMSELKAAYERAHRAPPS